MPGRRADANDAVVGHNIRAQRLARRMSQTELGQAIGVTFQQVQKYEKGMNRVGAGRLVRVAAVFGVPVAALLEGATAAGRPQAPLTARLLDTKERMRLAQAFASIPDRGVRRSLTSLAEGIARLSGPRLARR